MYDTNHIPRGHCPAPAGALDVAFAGLWDGRVWAVHSRTHAEVLLFGPPPSAEGSHSPGGSVDEAMADVDAPGGAAPCVEHACEAALRGISALACSADGRSVFIATRDGTLASLRLAAAWDGGADTLRVAGAHLFRGARPPAPRSDLPRRS